MNLSRMVLLLVCHSLALPAISAPATPPSSGYHLLKSVPLGPAPGESEYFDYVTVDSAARRVYMARNAKLYGVDLEALER